MTLDTVTESDAVAPPKSALVAVAVFDRTWPRVGSVTDTGTVRVGKPDPSKRPPTGGSYVQVAWDEDEDEQSQPVPDGEPA
jgi:hypothetical protein